jgi:hypothetical protein
MAYNIPIPFNPRSNFSFDPSSFKNNTSGNNSPTSVSDNPYNPTCNNQNQTMIENHHQLIRSYANQYGQTISYQPVRYNFNTHNFLYGEDPISGFHYSRKLKAIIDFSAYTSFLTKFGIMSDAEMTIYIPIREFENVWGPSKGTVYPLAGDIFIVDNSACDRPLGQTPMCWQVTDKDDNLKPVDYMGRHFYWKLVCKRFDYMTMRVPIHTPTEDCRGVIILLNLEVRNMMWTISLAKSLIILNMIALMDSICK